jgi:uncharacterized protein YndB with AHSA1/START domain
VTDASASITIVRTVPAAVDEVFAAWTDPALMRQWLAPEGCQVVEVAADPRPGGRHRVVVSDPAGNQHVVSGEYREVIASTRLVQTWDAQGLDPAVDPYPTLLTVDFRALGPASTEITLRQDQLLTVIDREGNREGWRQCFNKLERLLSPPEAPPPRPARPQPVRARPAPPGGRDVSPSD